MPNSLLNLNDADFVFVEANVELAEEATQLNSFSEAQVKDSSSLCLNPTQLNNLNLSYIEGPMFEKYEIEEGFVNTLGKYNIETAYKKMTYGNEVSFVVFQVTCDSKNADKSKNLPYINDVILAFLKENSEENITLLIPMAQCRSQLGKNKKHYVLVEITINGVDQEIMIHNSQSKWSTFGYLNCLKDLKGFNFNFNKHNTYSQQKDDFSCGFFVYRYVQSILESGSTEQLKNIRVSLATPGLSLDGLINDNLSRVTSLQQRRIIASENLPWDRKGLEKFLAIDYVENLDLDFPEDEDINEASKKGVLSAVNSVDSPLFFANRLNKLSGERVAEKAEQKLGKAR